MAEPNHSILRVRGHARGACDAQESTQDPPTKGPTIPDDLEHHQLAEIISSTIARRAAHFEVPAISPLINARMSEYATTVTVARHQSYPGGFQPYTDYSPYSSSPSTAVNSRAPSPTKEYDDEEEELSPGYHYSKWRLAGGFFACFMGGWADGGTGTVMPYLSQEFGLTSTLSSSLFAGSTCGFFAGTFLVESILRVFGRFRLQGAENPFPSFLPTFRKKTDDGEVGHSDTQARYLVLLLASVAHSMYFVMMGSRKGFSVMFLAYVVSAFSRALLTAPLNAYFAKGPKQALGYGLGLASLGSVISPLVCQSIIATGVPWHRFYYGSLVLSAFNVAFLAATFKPTTDETFQERKNALDESRRRKIQSLRSGRSSPTMGDDERLPDFSTVKLSPQRSALRIALSMPYQWAFSFFILLYCGSETTTQGFMVTFLLSTRNANPKSIGYVTSGFWGGISLGRFIWGYCVPFLTFTQRKHLVHVCIGVSVVMHLLIWFIKSDIQNAVYTSMIGVLYGPIFPACLSMANDILPAEVHMVVMALISSFASLGGAIFPLMAGAILDAKGIHTLTYVTVPLAAAMACLWVLFPSREPVRTTID
ncbi:major facilitator superfamily domain-containing protein [Crassisporium funariophilum]|nr:major facilitator superfamily domain-containing protein [Crassisporium funariophilum]